MLALALNSSKTWNGLFEEICLKWALKNELSGA